MRVLLACLFVWIAGVAQGNAQFGGASFFLSMTGNDGNDCLTPVTACRSVSRVNALLQIGHNDVILDSGYNSDETLNVTHGHDTQVMGPGLSWDANGRPVCAPNSQYLARIKVLWAQDNVALWAYCLTTGLVWSRQYAIVDLNDVACDGTAGDSMPTPRCILVDERSTMNCGPGKLYMLASVTSFIEVDRSSDIVQYCEIEIVNPNLKVRQFFHGARHSTLDLTGGSYSGHPLGAGLRWYWDDADVTLPAGGGAKIPGNGATQINNTVMR